MPTLLQRWRSRRQLLDMAVISTKAACQFVHASLVAFALLALTQHDASASDQADTHRLGELGRSDAKIADFYVFLKGDDLVKKWSRTVRDVGKDPAAKSQWDAAGLATLRVDFRHD